MKTYTNTCVSLLEWWVIKLCLVHRMDSLGEGGQAFLCSVRNYFIWCISIYEKRSSESRVCLDWSIWYKTSSGYETLHLQVLQRKSEEAAMATKKLKELLETRKSSAGGNFGLLHLKYKIHFSLQLSFSEYFFPSPVITNGHLSGVQVKIYMLFSIFLVWSWSKRQSK